MNCCDPISHTYLVEVQLLRAFVTVARRGSFSAAAAELGYTQAAVSQQIASLEADLKTRLLTRRPVAPTEAGARLLEHAGPILLRLDAARADVTRMTALPAATLTIGVTPLAGTATALATALARLRQQMPRLDITIQTRTRWQLAAGVARGELDLALTDGLTAPGDPLPELAPVTAVGLSQEQVRVVVPPGHPLVTRTTLRLTDLADARWIEAHELAPPLAEIRRLAGTEGFRPALHYTGQDTETLIKLASQGNGLTLLPEPAIRKNGVTSVPVTTPRLCHRMELIHAALPKNAPAAALAAILTSPSSPQPPAEPTRANRAPGRLARGLPKKCRR
jgi:DNA-binding transcriptional LysR family regulator